MDISRKRAVPSVSFSGSLTVEAALVLPIFLGAVLLLAGIFQTMTVCEAVNAHLCRAGRTLASYSEACNSSSTAALYRIFYSDMADSGIDVSAIMGGYGGILLHTEEEADSELLVLEASYRLKLPGYLTGSRSLSVTDRIYVRPWLGGRLSDARSDQETEKDRLVYVAENGVVYHTSEACTYLQLSIHSCTLSQIASLRNRYGARYVPCERCGHGSDASVVYITDTGRAWHSDRQCSGLKRQLHTMTQKEAEEQGLGPCSRCGHQ